MMKSLNKKTWMYAVLLGLLLLHRAGFAHEEVNPMNRVSFQVEARREVANDWVTATMGISENGREVADLADRINKTMEWALEITRAQEGIKFRSGGYQTYPVYEKSRLKDWRASQQLIIEGNDVDRISKLLGQLQARLQLQSIQFSVSPKIRQQMEEILIKDVLEGYKTRAKLIQDSLGARGYQTIKININTSGGHPRPMMHRTAMSGAVHAEMAKPAFEAGSSHVSVQVNATIELD